MSPRRGEPGDGRAPSGARWVAVGIFASRILGFVRQRAFAFFFGVGPHTDVLNAAFKGPNLLQNLLGEGTLSAAFIPIYSRMVEEGREKEASRFAGAILGLLLVVASAVALLGVLLARPLVALLSPGFLGDAAAVAAGELAVDRFALTVTAVRILFPMTALLVLAAWTLGVLNSHRRFLLPYMAPVLWNLSILTLLLGAGVFGLVESLDYSHPESLVPATLDRLVLAACWGGLLGGALQFLVQLPSALGRLPGFRVSLSLAVPGVRRALAAFGPVVAGRGVYQLSSYLDLVLASFLAAGALAGHGFALQLVGLPIALFGLSVAAAELPELARQLSREGQGAQEARRGFAERLGSSLAQMSFFVLPTALGYLAFGYWIVGALFRTGDFGIADTALVAAVLGAYSLGLPATAASRLMQNSFFALGDTRTPALRAALRVSVSVAVAVPAMLLLDRLPVTVLPGLAPGAGEAGRQLALGAVGLGLGSAVGAWVELASLGRALGVRLSVPWPWGVFGRQLALAVGAAVPSWVWMLALPASAAGHPARLHPALAGVLLVGIYAASYLGSARLLGISQLGAWLGRRD